MLERAPYEDELPIIGRLAVMFQLTNEEQVRAALAVQQQQTKRGDQVSLGEILLQREVITREQLDLLHQAQDYLQHVKKDGTAIDVLLGISSVLIANAVDLKQAQQKTQRAYQEIHSIYRNSLAGLRVVDSGFTVIQINDSLANMTGIPKSQIIGAKCFEVLPGPHCHTERCTLARIQRGEILRGEEVIKRGAVDRELVVLLSAAPFYDSEGKLTGMVQDLHDITEKKKLESIAEAVESMNNIGYIFSGIRHEIGNPINSMKMSLNVLKNNIDSFPKEKILKYIDRTIDQVSKMESLLRSLKSFSMFEKPFIRCTNLKVLVDDLLHLVREDFAVRDIEIKAAVMPGADLVRVDSRALQQVLLNVLTNASDALVGRPAPRITVCTRRIADMVCLVVQDNGRGMSSSEKENLFKPFCTSKPHGTGLGLVIAKKMLTAMECGIDIQSRQGLGTEVIIRIPALIAREGP